MDADVGESVVDGEDCDQAVEECLEAGDCYGGFGVFFVIDVIYYCCCWIVIYY